MYGIYANIGGILMVNVTIYSIHGSYGSTHNNSPISHQKHMTYAKTATSWVTHGIPMADQKDFSPAKSLVSELPQHALPEAKAQRSHLQPGNPCLAMGVHLRNSTYEPKITTY